MDELNKYARDAGMLNNFAWGKGGNSSGNNTGLNTQYFAEATRANAESVGELADNCYDAVCQGLDGKDWYEWTAVKIRTDFAVTTATGELMPDDWQRIHIILPARYTYIPVGAYIKYAGSTWIIDKSYNMGAGLGQAIARRCNQVISLLDWYGNIVKVPMSYAKMATLGNSSHASENSIVAKNYINCICQMNDYSRGFDENTRIILGRTAYAMRGVNNFTREFTEEEDSTHLISFTIERVEPITSDDLELSCADYHSFSWEIEIGGSRKMKRGSSQKLEISSRRNGAETAGSEERPVTYRFSSSDESVATVSAEGTVEAIGLGEATISVELEQNPGIRREYDISVEEGGERYAAFTSTIPASMKEMQSCFIEAAVFEGGEPDDSKMTLSGSGAETYCYSIEESGENRWKLICYGAASMPLTLRAESQGTYAETDIILSS